MLRGSTTGQTGLARRLLQSTPMSRRYVLEHDGEVVGMGALATLEHPRPDVPPSVLLGAPATLGPVNGLRSILGALRGVATIIDPPGPDEAQIHSLVVDDAHRGKGFGGLLLRHLEDDALTLGKHLVVLQVVRSNTTARGFYGSAGYSVTDLTRGRLRDRVAYPSVIMRRRLVPAG